MTRLPVQKMGVSATQTFSADEIKTWSVKKLEDFHARSERLKRPDLRATIEAELASRAERATRESVARPQRRTGKVVTEYHFVCANNRGVTTDADGTFRTGSWVVAEDRVKASLAHGAIVALHGSRGEPSYRQGELIGYRFTQRDMIDKDNIGIEFHVRPSTLGPLMWVGDATGEKGYRYE